MIIIYGLKDEIANVSYYDSSGQSEYGFNKPYSEDTARKIDREVSKIIETEYERAKKILTENREKLDRLAEKLLRSEEHTSELQSRGHLVCRLLLEKKKPI